MARFGPELALVAAIMFLAGAWGYDRFVPAAEKAPIAARPPLPTFRNLNFAEADGSGAIADWELSQGYLETGYAFRRIDGSAGADSIGSGAVAEIHYRYGDQPEYGASLRQSAVAEPYRGKRLRLTGRLLADGKSATDGAQLTLISVGKGRGVVLYESSNRVVSKEWRAHRVEVDVPTDAERVQISASIHGRGPLRVSDLRVEIVGEAKATFPKPAP
jgi:hypothetical protein